jgi:AraC-like DNA-binding protein/mannose-6-phosphate isomerase-like protein (cupin superfamily)
MKNRSKSLFDVLLLNREIDKSGKHEIEFPSDFPLVVREYTFRFEFPLKPNFHEYLEIIYILKNRAILQYSGKRYDVQEGDLIVIGKNEIHNCFQYDNESVTLISLKFLTEMIFSFIGYDLDFEYIRPFYSKSSKFNNHIKANKIDNQKILEKMLSIKNIIEKKKTHYKIKAKNILTEILLDIIEFYDVLPTDLHDKHSKHLQDLERLKGVFHLLNNEYYEKITLAKAAKVACLNETYFSVFFKKVTGFTFSNYFQRIRIEKAKELLTNTDFSTSRIAFSTGFNTQNYFNKTFKKFTKLTPSAYREKINTYC